jgi:hypothetical protein
MTFKQGVSGNPNGRPIKSRALTAILEAGGNKTIAVGDRRIARKRLIAQLLWQAVTEGSIKLPNGKTIEISPDDFLTIVQFLYKHIDGPPLQNIDLTTGGKSLDVVLKVIKGVSVDDL